MAGDCLHCEGLPISDSQRAISSDHDRADYHVETRILISNPRTRCPQSYPQRTLQDGRVRVSLFQENISDALISQSAVLVPGSTTLFAFVQNIDRVRSRGVEFVAQKNNIFIRGLELSGSITYVDSRILEDSANSLAVGNARRRCRIGAQRWWQRIAPTPASAAKLLAGRYSGRQFAQIDNLDVYEHTYQGFEAFFVVYGGFRVQLDKNWSAAVGIDNLTNRDYFLFHPFPQRTAVAEVKFQY